MKHLKMSVQRTNVQFTVLLSHVHTRDKYKNRWPIFTSDEQKLGQKVMVTSLAASNCPFQSKAGNDYCSQPPEGDEYMLASLLRPSLFHRCTHNHESSGLCVEPPLHRLDQQLCVLLQQGQGLLALTSGPELHLQPLTPWAALRQRVQLGLDCQQGLWQDAPHLALIYTGLLAVAVPLQHLGVMKTYMWKTARQGGKRVRVQIFCMSLSSLISDFCQFNSVSCEPIINRFVTSRNELLTKSYFDNQLIV